MGRLRGALKNSLLVLVSLLVTCLVIWAAGETYFRVAYEVRNYNSPTDWVEYHPVLGWKIRPGTYSYFEIGAFNNVRAFVNELGIRNPPIALRTPAGKKRITVVGDSFVFAAALTDGDKFTDQLQTLAGADTEIVNVSVPGYGTGQQTVLLQDLAQRGLEFGDKVILVFFTNDVADNAGYDYGTLTKLAWKPSFQIDAQGALLHTAPQQPEVEEDRLSITQKSIFLQFIRNQGEILVGRFPVLLDVMAAFGYRPALGRVPGVIAGWYSDGWESEWQRTERILVYLRDYLRGKNVELVMTTIPSPFQVEAAFRTLIENQKSRDGRVETFLADPDRPQRVLAEFCQRNGIRFIDTTSVLRERNKTAPVFFLREGHLNQEGSRVVAQDLHRGVIEAR